MVSSNSNVVEGVQEQVLPLLMIERHFFALWHVLHWIYYRDHSDVSHLYEWHR